MDLQDLTRRDRRLVKLARRVKVLTTLGWPPEVEERFLASMQAGQPELPRPPQVDVDLSEVVDGLHQLLAILDESHPLERFLVRTARAVIDTAQMLQGAHTPAFTQHAIALYGQPRQALHPGAPTHLEAAEHFVERSVRPRLGAPAETLSDAEAAAAIRQALSEVFADAPLPVELDERLTSKAAAGSRRVALRTGARFSPTEVAQLIEHEALVHSATKRAGRAQPVLSALGLSTARTTLAQEGLATFAEMITDTMDLFRLRRIALRIVAIQAALDGADFIEVFHLFQEAGQRDTEAFHSARRIFRGGDVRGRVVFTKDVVYLRGLFRVHTFLLEAGQAGRDDLIRVLFSGRMTLGDALELEPFFRDGTLTYGPVMPAWAHNTACLAAYLAWAAYNDRFSLQALSLDDFRES